MGLNAATLKTTFERNPNAIDAIFKNQLDTDTAEVVVTTLGTDTQPGSYSISKSGSDYLIDGVAMTNSGSTYTSSSGNSTGMVLTISDTSVTAANVYYGKSLMFKSVNYLVE